MIDKRLLIDCELTRASIFGETIVEECNSIMRIINQQKGCVFLFYPQESQYLLASLRKHLFVNYYKESLFHDCIYKALS